MDINGLYNKMRVVKKAELIVESARGDVDDYSADLVLRHRDVETRSMATEEARGRLGDPGMSVDAIAYCAHGYMRIGSPLQSYVQSLRDLTKAGRRIPKPRSDTHKAIHLLIGYLVYPTDQNSITVTYAKNCYRAERMYRLLPVEIREVFSASSWTQDLYDAAEFFRTALGVSVCQRKCVVRH